MRAFRPEGFPFKALCPRIKKTNLKEYSKHISRANIIDDWKIEDLPDAYNRLFIPSSKTAMLVDYNRIYAFKIILNFTIPPKLLEERFSGSFFCVYGEVNNPFGQILATKLQKLMEAGLIDYNMRFWLNAINPKLWEVESGPKILTLDELEAGFVVCMAPLVISAVVFCFEWLITVKNYVVFCFIFKKCLKFNFQ